MSCGFVFEITPRCNLNCSFCYNVWKTSDKLPPELPLAKIRRLLSKLAEECSFSWLTFAGGEPLLHPDLSKVVHFVHKRWPRVRLGIATNGLLLSEGVCSELVQSGVSFFELPLFTAKNTRFSNLTRGRLEDLESVKLALSIVKQQGAGLGVAVFLSSQIEDELAEVFDLAIALGADRVSLNRFIPTGAGRKNRACFELGPEKLCSLLTIADAKAEEFFLPVHVTMPVEECHVSHEDFPHLEFSKCVCGSDKWVIDCQGNLRTCEQNAVILGNILREDFRKLSCLEYVYDFRARARYSQCAGCAKIATCGGGCKVEQMYMS